MKQPLAEILRPKQIGDYVGQSHLMGQDSILRLAIENDNLHSMILWGPPGVGKTTLALLIAEQTGADFFMLSAINSGVKDIREVFTQAEKSEKKAILFIDEIHRFSKSQQDSLLGAVERGDVTLIGATTENPSFEVISPLLSRCQVYILKTLEKNELEHILTHACRYLEKELQITIELQENEALLRISGGDARKLINAIELVATTIPPNNGKVVVTNELVTKIIQKNLVIYDKKGENHYDIISAFIKSLRGSDPNAAVYWLARMLEAGEDPLFIARRMIILASEDIGNANPNALLLANNCFQAVHHIGMPEARIILSQTAVYLASSPKSNASYMAINEAIEWVKKTGDLPVPLHLRNAPTQLMKEIGYSDGYRYAHHYENNFVEQEFLPSSISGKKFYEPQDNPRENELRKYLQKCWQKKYQYILLLWVMLTAFLHTSAQDLHYSQYYASPPSINPAYSGLIDGQFRISGAYRNQWLSVSVPFNTYSLNFDAPLYNNGKRKNLIGIGAEMALDQAGDGQYRLFQGNLSLSFVKGIGARNKAKWGIGFFSGFAQRSLDFGALYFDEQFVNGVFNPKNPVSEPFPAHSYFYFDCGVGTVLQLAPNKNNLYSFSVTVNHLNRPRQSLYVADKRMDIKPVFFFISKIKITSEIIVTPSLLTAFQGKYMNIVGGTGIEYRFPARGLQAPTSIGAGVYYRWNDALIFAGIFEWKRIRFGFSYDVNLSTFFAGTQGRGGFELTLSYIHKKPFRSKTGRENCPFEFM